MLSTQHIKIFPIINLKKRRHQQRILKICTRIRALDNIKNPPWSLTFDLKEKDTLWTPENKVH